MLSTVLASQNPTQKPHVTCKADGFAAPLVLTKTPRKAHGLSVVLAENQPNMGPLTTPTKGREAGTGDPWTPTSNLKMLISAASPDIRNREKELCMDSEGGEAVDPMQDPELGEEAERLISRKEKSLGLLCHKFIACYPEYPNPALNNDICLHNVATELNTERRRIYDIMNVLESLHMVSRSAKNRYTWHGRSKLTETLAILRKVGEEHRYGQQMQQIRQRCLDREFDFDGGEEKENEELVVDSEGSEAGQKEMFFVELPGVEFKAASVNSRKDKSLRVMSQKFVMLFLVAVPRVVSLEVAAKILIGEDQLADQDKNKFKTKVRRLYDIANVLRSLRLIEKVHVTEERGRKPAFQWTGPEDLPDVRDLVTSAPGSPSASKRVPESHASADNCAKNLFSSPGTKRGFTRHPSLIKLAKSIQDDRRKINSAPTSPVKSILSDYSNSDFFPNKMAQLAAICKIRLDQQSTTGDKGSKPPVTEHTPVTMQTPIREQTPVRTAAPPPEAPPEEPRVDVPVHLTPQTQLLPPQTPGAMSYLPARCSPLIPVLLPQQRGAAGPYAVYLHHPAALRPHPLARPQPTSLAVRSMTFEDKTGQSPTGLSPATAQQPPRGADLSPPSAATKRLCSDRASESSPSKAKRVHHPNARDVSPNLCDILQARLRSRRGGLLSSRPSRALHLDPEFVNTPGASSSSGQTLEHSLETFLEKEDRASDSEAGLTPVRAVPLTPGHMQTETLVPAGYLIPISQQSLLAYKDLHASCGDGSRAPTPTYNIYHTPTAGSRPPSAQEITPTRHPLHRPPGASPFPPQGHRVHTNPSPAIVNFTLQNLGLIQGPGPAYAHGHTPERLGAVHAPLGLQPRGMVFVKPISPVPVQQASCGQPLTLISVQQPAMTTPKGTSLPTHSFFHTPVSISPLATVMTPSTHASSSSAVYIPQRKLDVSTEES